MLFPSTLTTLSAFKSTPLMVRTLTGRVPATDSGNSPSGSSNLFTTGTPHVEQKACPPTLRANRYTVRWLSPRSLTSFGEGYIQRSPFWCYCKLECHSDDGESAGVPWSKCCNYRTKLESPRALCSVDDMRHCHNGSFLDSTWWMGSNLIPPEDPGVRNVARGRRRCMA